MKDYKILDDSAVEAQLKCLSRWTYVRPSITATYTFKSFSIAVGFVNRVFLLAAELDHHPEFHFSYNTVKFALCTHDAGMRVTEVDISTSKLIDQIATDCGAE